MDPHRIVPNLNVDDATTGHDFYEEFLGLEKQFDLGWVASFRSKTHPSVQVSLVSGDASAPEQSAMSVQVADVDAAYAEAQTPRLRDRPPTHAGALGPTAVLRPRPARRRGEHRRARGPAAVILAR